MRIAFVLGLCVGLCSLTACIEGGTSGSTNGATGGNTAGSSDSTAAPQASAPAGTYDDDFTLELTSATPGATICYTLDGSSPGCTAGICQGSAATYSSTSKVPIDGTVTSTLPNDSYGTVTVTALACKAGYKDGLAAPLTYTLQVATPALSNPSTSDPVPYGTTTLTPTVSSSTEGASAFYTTSAAFPPTCGGGTAIAALPSQVSISLSAGDLAPALYVIGCKPGYKPSDVLNGVYAFALNPPRFTPPAAGVIYDGDVDILLDDTANFGSGDVVCFNVGDAGAPPCGCDPASQVAGGTATGFLAITTGSIIHAVACPPSGSHFVASAPGSSGSYVLKLDTPAFTPPAGTEIPFGGALEVTIGQGGNGEPYDYICWSHDGTGPDCNCDLFAHPSWHKVLGNSTIAFITDGPVQVQAVGCLNSFDVAKFLPSDTGSATYPSAPQMNAPTILPADGVISTVPQPVNFTNNDEVDAYFCYTLDNTAPPTSPACAAAGSPNCTTTAVPAGRTSTDGPSVSTAGTVVRAIACDHAGVKAPSEEATPVTFN